MAMTPPMARAGWRRHNGPAALPYCSQIVDVTEMQGGSGAGGMPQRAADEHGVASPDAPWHRPGCRGTRVTVQRQSSGASRRPVLNEELIGGFPAKLHGEQPREQVHLRPKAVRTDYPDRLCGPGLCMGQARRA